MYTASGRTMGIAMAHAGKSMDLALDVAAESGGEVRLDGAAESGGEVRLDGEDLLRINDEFFDLLGVIFYSLCGIAVGTDAERILPINFEQVGSFVENVGDGLVVHR